MEAIVKSIEALITKAAEAADSGDAMRFSQAAVNCANTVAQLNTQGAYKDSPQGE